MYYYPCNQYIVTLYNFNLIFALMSVTGVEFYGRYIFFVYNGIDISLSIMNTANVFFNDLDSNRSEVVHSKLSNEG